VARANFSQQPYGAKVSVIVISKTAAGYDKST